MLVTIARWVRSWFGLQPLILLSSLILFAVKILRDPPSHWIGVAIVVAIEIGLTSVSGMAWYALRKGKSTARGWALTASILSLPVPGIGTAAGIVGLIAFSRRKIVAQMAVAATPETPRIAGDGTSKALDQIAGGGQIVALLIANHYWNSWARLQSLPASNGLLLWVVEFEIALQISILLHELGHVAGGWASHMKLRHLVVGPFEWTMREGRSEVRFNASGLWGRGAAGMVPTTLKHIRTQRILTTLGGPLGSLVAGCLGLIGALSAKGSLWEPWWGCFTMLATLGMISCAASLIPMRPEDQYSDGAHLVQLISRGPWADVHAAFSVAGATLATPLRARDFNLRALDRATSFLTTGKQAMLLRMFKYLHHLDSGRMDAAVAAALDAEGLYPGVAATLEAELHTDFIFVHALLRKDLNAARTWWHRMERKGVKRFNADYWKARTALLWLEGLTEQAEEAWQQGNALAQKLPAAGAYEFDRWCFHVLRETLDGATAQPPPLPEPAGMEHAEPLTDSAQLAGRWVPLEQASLAG